MAVTIGRDAAINILKNSGFLYRGKTDGITQFEYRTGSGFAMSFAVQWLDCGYDAKFNLDDVRRQVSSMLESARLEEMVYKFLKNPAKRQALADACMAFGMRPDDDGTFYYVVDGKALFGVELDYLASLVCTGKADVLNLQDTLEAMKDSAETEAQLKKMSEGIGIKNFRKPQ